MEPTDPAFVLAARIRRLAAFVIDLLLLAIIGHAVGIVFFKVVTQWGPYGRIFGFVLMTGYLGTGASVLLHGRSIGKRVCGLEVRRIGGGYLAIGPAVARS
jgi:uncharacterized RDD family membrane protein YckC